MEVEVIVDNRTLLQEKDEIQIVFFGRTAFGAQMVQELVETYNAIVLDTIMILIHGNQALQLVLVSHQFLY